MIEFKLQEEQEVEAQPVQPDTEAPSELSPGTPAQTPEGNSGENEGEGTEGE